MLNTEQTSGIRRRSFGSFRSPYSLVWSAAIAILLAATACGKKGDPTPPVRAIPAPVKDLAVYQQGSDFILQFGYPKTTIAGGPLPGIARIELMEMLQPAPAEGFNVEVEPRRFAAASEIRMNLNEVDLANSTSGDRVFVRLPVPEGASESAYSFGVRTLASNGEISGISNVASMVPATPPEPPTSLNVVPNPDGLEVNWQPQGTMGEGFNLYRRDARSRSYNRKPTPIEADKNQFLDTTARYGQRYIYTVTTVARRDPLVESRLSGEAEVLYQDRFSPEPPAGLVALTESDRVRLRWDPSSSRDVQSYHVYRQDDGDFRRLTSSPTTKREFLDSGVRVGGTYTYRITGLDALGNEGDPGEEVTVTLR
ncbi:MAG: hypothetical protein K0U98_10205 [Deltaproteobacteria bacterium]|nr:hypothetical protein [Deltaproteobacteria bacterium]